MSVDKDTLTAEMRREWDSLSQENAFHFIATLRDDWPEEDFLISGEQEVSQMVDPFLMQCGFVARDKRMLEIGCGVGRMTFALAKRFATVEAVDISGEMIRRAKELQERKGISNIHFRVGSGRDLEGYPSDSMDFCFSYIVFQHIPDVSMILNYILEIGRVLKENGLFKIQVNGYRRIRFPKGYYLMWGISSTLRLRKWKINKRPYIWFGKLNTWDGVPISVSELQETCAAAGLACTQLTGVGTQFMWLTGRKASGAG